MNRIVNSEPTSIFAFTGRPLDKDVGLQVRKGGITDIDGDFKGACDSA